MLFISLCSTDAHFTQTACCSHQSHFKGKHSNTCSVFKHLFNTLCTKEFNWKWMCMNLFIQFIPSQKKKWQQNQKKSWSTLSNLYKKKCRGWKVKKQKQTKKNLLQSHKRHKWLFSQKTHNIGDPQRDSSFPSLTLTTQTPPGFRRVQRWQAAALLTIA